MKDASAGVFVFPEGDFRNCALLRGENFYISL